MKKKKAPAFQFYVKDWLGDQAIRKASACARGIWIDLLCFMWQNDHSGSITGTKPELCRMLGVTPAELDQFLDENERHKIADVTNGHNQVTIINRRMSREHNTREDNRLRKQKSRVTPPGHENVTPPSSSSSSSASSKEEKETPNFPETPPPTGAVPSSENCPRETPAIPSDAANTIHMYWQSKAGDGSKLIAQETIDGIDRVAIKNALQKVPDLKKITDAIDNFSKITTSNDYWPTRTIELRRFLDRWMLQYLTENDPFTNFKTTRKPNADTPEFQMMPGETS